MNEKALVDLSYGLSQYIVTLKRAPTTVEIQKYIREFLRARSKGRLMV